MFQPLGNSTVLPATAWHPEPQTRGTFSILSNCLITMSLCIWTSLHLNVPEHKKEHLQKYRKLGWMLLGLIAPEMVVWNAWEQRRQMKKVSKLMQEKGFMPLRPSPWTRIRDWVAKVWQWISTCLLLRAKDWPELAESTPYKPHNGRTHHWTDAHSWYVVMGGMSFEDSAEEDQQFMPENRQRFNITMECFEYVLETRENLIPDISLEYIQDKSKFDRLTKLLTCWQAGYFCIQCLYRLSQQLSITLLELDVFAHAICALALFVIWSDKPRDICEPTLIVGEDAMDICALLSLDGRGDNHWKDFLIADSPEHPDKSLEIVQPTSFFFHRLERKVVWYGAIGSHCSLKVLKTYWVLNRVRAPLDIVPTIITIDARDLMRLQRVARFVQQEESRSFGLTCVHPAKMPRVYKGDWHSIARTKNWSPGIQKAINLLTNRYLEEYRPSRFIWLVIGMTFAGTCYGGLHLVAWKSPFASRAELLLWRAASLSIMATGPFCALLTPWFRFILSADKEDHREARSSEDFLSFSHPTIKNTVPNFADKIYVYMFVYCGMIRLFMRRLWAITIVNSFCFFLILWYIFCRVFIIVESFIMLAHIPDRALQVPTWSAYIPHIV
jgi:hypothetical protein